MPSPDLTPYIDLALEDAEAQDIFDIGRDLLLSRVPDLVLRETSHEAILLEAFAYQIEQSVFRLNRLPGTMFDILMQMYGVERYLGAAPTTTLTFTLATADGYTIPIGTRAALTTDFGTMVFSLDEGIVVPPGTNVGTGAATGDSFISNFNGVPAGTALSMVDPVPFVDYVRLDSVVTGGDDAETDDEWRSRGVTRFGRLTETLILPDHFVAAALEEPLVVRAYGLDNYNPGTAGAPGDHAGHMTVAVYGNGAVLTAAQRTALEASLSESTAANLAVHVIDPSITTVNVTATLRASVGMDVDWVRTEAINTLQEYLNTSTWLWAGTVRRNELISVLDQSLGVDYVESITTPAGDVPLTGYAPLVAAGTLNITVTTA